MILLWLFAILAVVRADTAISVDSQDLSVKYTSTNTSDTGATWSVTPRGPTDCDTPQTISARLGDEMSFTFTGNSIYIIGTMGPRRGVIHFALDGNTTTFDRTGTTLMCDVVLFQALNLPFIQHTVTATLVQRELDIETQAQDGVLAIQNLRYTTPGGGGGGSSKTPIIGGAVGAVALILIVAIASWLWVRHRRRLQNPHRSGGGAGFFDTDDVPQSHAKDNITPGLVATPFEWNQHSMTEGGDHQPGSPSTQPLLFGSHYGLPTASPNNHASSSGSGGRPALAPLGIIDRRTSSGGSDRRENGGLFAANPDRDTNTSVSHTKASRSSEKVGAQSYPMAAIPQRQSMGAGPSAAGGEDLVDRIAERLANIMAERVGVAPDAAPPMYSGPAEPSHSQSPPAVAGSPPYSASASQPTFSSNGAPRIPPPPGSTAPLIDAEDPSEMGYTSNANRFGPRPRPAGARTSVSGGRPNTGGSSRPNTAPSPGEG